MTDAAINELTNETPLDRIKEELPEFCQLVAVARMMSGSNDKAEVKKQVDRMLDILLSVPIQDAIPSLAQRKGSESFLLAASTYTSSYAAQLDAHTGKLLTACNAFRDAVNEMEKLKTTVVQKYSSTIMEFEEIVASAKVPGGSKLANYIDSTIASVVGDKMKESVNIPRPTRDPPSVPLSNESLYDLQQTSLSPLLHSLTSTTTIPGSVQELEPLISSSNQDTVIPVVTRETTGGGLHTFFQDNNTLSHNSNRDQGVTVAAMDLEHDDNEREEEEEEEKDDDDSSSEDGDETTSTEEDDSDNNSDDASTVTPPPRSPPPPRSMNTRRSTRRRRQSIGRGRGGFVRT